MPEPKDPKRDQLKEWLGPGFWIDQNDHLHVSLSEMCEAVGLPVTQENMELARQAAMELILKQHPEAEIVDRRTKND